MLLELCQGVVLLLEALVLGGLPAKGPDDPHAGEVLPGGAQHLVQARLHLLVPGHGPQHHAEHHHRQQGDGHHEHQRRGHVDGKGHHHGAEYHKGGAQQQPQGQVQAVLHLVDVAGHAGDKGGGAHGVHLGVAQGLDVGEQVVPQLGGNAHRGLGREELGGDGAHQAHHAQAGHHQAHAALDFLGVHDRTHGNQASTGTVGLFDALVTENRRTGREIRPLDNADQIVEQFFAAGFRMVQCPMHAFGHLTHVVRRDIGGHADGDAGRSIAEQVREAGRQHGRLLGLAIVVR